MLWDNTTERSAGGNGKNILTCGIGWTADLFDAFI